MINGFEKRTRVRVLRDWNDRIGRCAYRAVRAGGAEKRYSSCRRSEALQERVVVRIDIGEGIMAGQKGYANGRIEGLFPSSRLHSELEPDQIRFVSIKAHRVADRPIDFSDGLNDGGGVRRSSHCVH